MLLPAAFAGPRGDDVGGAVRSAHGVGRSTRDLGSVGGEAPLARHRTQATDEPGNLDSRISGYRATRRRLAAVSTSSQQVATQYGGPPPAASTARPSASATLRAVERTAAPRSSSRFQISTMISARAGTSRSATSIENAGLAGRVGSSKSARRPCCLASRSTNSWAARWPASRGSCSSSRVNAIARGRPIAFPSFTQTSSGAEAPSPRSSSPTRAPLNPTFRPSWAWVSRRRLRVALRSRPNVPAIDLASLVPSASMSVRLCRSMLLAASHQALTWR